MMYLSVRPDLIDAAFLHWWVPGARVTAFLGTDDKAGRLRVEYAPAGEHVLVKANGKSSLCSLKLPVFSWVDENEHVSELVDVGYSDKWLEIGLPPWASNTAVWVDAPKSAQSKAPVVVPKTPLTQPPEPQKAIPLTHDGLPKSPAEKIVKGFAMAAMALPDTMIGAREANVRQPK
jgi:hypothetical protein